VKLNIALIWAFDEERYGRTVTVPLGVWMTFSLDLDRTVLISTGRSETTVSFVDLSICAWVCSPGVDDSICGSLGAAGGLTGVK
jgi:hypothetical protein